MAIDTWRDYKLKNLSKQSTYIAGKIGDCSNFEELFHQGQIEVQKLGLVPISPIELNLPYPEEYMECMKVDITVLMRCSNIYMLRNYKDSKGAMMELTIAQFLGLNIIYQPELGDIIYNEK